MSTYRIAALAALVVTIVATIAFGVYPPALKALAAAFDGSGYVQVAPTFTGSDGNTSYFRLSNDGSASTTFTVKIVGTPSAAVYGTANITVAAGASPQYSLSDLLTQAAAGSLSSADTGYAVYIQNTSTTAFYQHVIFNSGNGFFENMSTCKFQGTGNYSGLNSRLDNVHTSKLSAYPAKIAIHNYGSTSVTYNAAVYDAANGTSIGTVPITVAANATDVHDFSYYEQQLGWTPNSSQLHVNIVFTASGTSTYAAEVSNYIYNANLQGGPGYVNMTQRCPTAAASTATSSVCPSSNFLTVTQNSKNTAYAAPTLSVTCSTSQVTVTSNSIPNFEFVQTTPNALKSQTKTYKFPITPTVATGTNITVPLVGPTAVTVGGLPIYGPTESPQDGSQDPYKNNLLDYCGGHTDQSGLYHHHYRPDCLISGGTTNKTGVVLGYAFDGYPILAPYECTDTTCKTVYKVHSSYKYIGGSTASWSSNAYVSGYGTLDKCNGMTRPDGTYAYYATDEFPYFVACYHGAPDTSNLITSSGSATIITQ